MKVGVLPTDYNRCPGTPQNKSVREVDRTATTIVTQIARPRSNFLTYGSRMVRVRKGVDSDWRRKTRIGSNSYWCEMSRRIATMNGMRRKNRLDFG